MRILQLIDSLDAGGAERMAVNYANGLATEIEFSGLVVTRKEGHLANQISKDVSYLFLNKKSTIDFKALKKLRHFVVSNRVAIVHAHSSSFFTAFLLKLSKPSVQIIWHDHYGNSEFLSKRPVFALKICSFFFSGVIAVNQQLKKWSEQKLKTRSVVYLPNFPTTEEQTSGRTILNGIDGKRIVLLANLRVQKNHFLIIELAKKLQISHPDWSFHLIGKDFEDAYSKELKALILSAKLENTVFCYGSRQDIKPILEQSTIGVLTSHSEGLPVALLEYGIHKKPVVVTNVGEIPLVIQNRVNGFLIDADNGSEFYSALLKLMENKDLQSEFGKALQTTVFNNYSQKKVLIQYLDWLITV